MAKVSVYQVDRGQASRERRRVTPPVRGLEPDKQRHDGIRRSRTARLD